MFREGEGVVVRVNVRVVVIVSGFVGRGSEFRIGVVIWSVLKVRKEYWRSIEAV